MKNPGEKHQLPGDAAHFAGKVPDGYQALPVEKIRVRPADSHPTKPWVEGDVFMASENLGSLALLFDEGISIHDAGIIGGRLVLLLAWDEQRLVYRTLMTGERYDVQFQGRMEQYTIYQSPSDYPGKFVVRRFLIAANSVTPAPGKPRLASSLEEARGLIPGGLAMFQRDPADDPVIVETWL